MRIALPIEGEQLAQHFGHASRFAIFTVNDETKAITGLDRLVPPPHEPGVLPAWLAQEGANVILAGGMGQRARSLFEEQGIRVVTGITEEDAGAAVAAFLAGHLAPGENPCDH